MNPYLDEYNKLSWNNRWGYSKSNFDIAIPNDRKELVRKYSWAIPNDEALKKIANCGPLIEIGAGTGYWASLLRHDFNVDILAFDKHPPHYLRRENKFHRETSSWIEILEGGPEMVAKHSGRTLFLCWPPYSNPMAADCLKHYRGKRLVYVGEDDGGCTGDWEFHRIIESEFVRVDCVYIPQWFGIHDQMMIYKRK
jgi:hypothetical protein